MKFVVLASLFIVFQTFVWADVTGDDRSRDVGHIELPAHLPHHPTNKDPTDQGGHDGIVYPRKRLRKGLLEGG